jgi:hypothetical protein
MTSPHSHTVKYRYLSTDQRDDMKVSWWLLLGFKTLDIYRLNFN